MPICSFIYSFQKKRHCIILCNLVALFWSFHSNIALADEIWIRSKTSIFPISSLSENRDLAVCLVDDLHHPIANARLQIAISDLHQPLFHETRLLSTDENGRIYADFDLPRGDYRAKIHYEGSETYGEADLTLSFSIAPCRQTAAISWNSDPVFEPHDTIAFSLVRQSCAMRTADWMISAGPESARVRFNPGESAIAIQWKASEFESGKTTIEAVALENERLERESTTQSFLVLDADLDKNIAFFSTFSHRYAQYSLSEDFSEWLKENQKSCALSVYLDERRDALLKTDFSKTATQADWEISSMPPIENTDTPSVLRFEIPYALPTEWIYALRCPDSRQRPILTGHAHTPRPIAPTAIGASFAACLLAALVISRVRRWKSRRSKSPIPKPQSHIQRSIQEVPPTHAEEKKFHVESPSTSHTSDRIKLVCMDSETKKRIDLSTCTFQPALECTAEFAYFTAPRGTPIEIHHADYLPWRGKLKGSGFFEIELEPRRHYIGQCFCAIAERILGDDVPWGSLSPEALFRQSKDILPEKLIQNARFMRDLSTFCSLVSRTTFGCPPIDDSEIDAIYQLSISLKKSIPQKMPTQAAGSQRLNPH